MSGGMPVQTPVTFLNGGAASMFSAECIKLMAECEVNPKDVGSYDYVKKRIKKAQESPQAQIPGTPEHGLANSTAGHLQQNGASQRLRGQPCSNVVDGHSLKDAPAIPLRGSKSTLGSEERLASDHEDTAPTRWRNPSITPEPPPPPHGTGTTAGGPPLPGSVYSAARMETDADNRLRQIDRFKPATQPTAAVEGTAPTGTPTNAPQSVRSAGGAQGQSIPKANDPWQQEITGKTAVDCINDFRKKAEAAMKQKCIDDVPANEKKANGGLGRTPEQGAAHREQLEKAAAPYSAARRSAQAQVTAAKNAVPPDPVRIQAAENAHVAAQQAASPFEGPAAAARNAHCLHQQGLALMGNGAQVDGRMPSPVDSGT